MMPHHDWARESLITAFAALLAGMTIGNINQYLQAGAFIVSMIAGLAATRYYLRKSKQTQSDADS